MQLDQDVQALETAIRGFFQLMKRPQTWQAITEQAGLNVDRPGAGILLHLAVHPHESCRVQDLAHQMGVEAPSITRKTQELEQLGFLKRLPHPTDKRAVILKITPEGQAIVDRYRAVQIERLSQALADWEPSERREFIRLFQRFSSDLAKAKQTK